MKVHMRWFGVMAVVASLGVLTAAEEPAKKGPNQAPVDEKATVSAEAEAVKDLNLAYSLVRYGRKAKSPEALVMAAKVLAGIGSQELKAKPVTETDPKAPKDAPAKPVGPVASAKALLDEAKAMAKNDAAVVAMADKVELNRGAVGGPKRSTDVVKALSIDSFSIGFRGGEVARVAISGDGDTRLDLYVYDESGNLIDSRVGPGDDALCTWVPKWSGKFTIRIVNRGLVANQYVIATN